MKLTYKGHEIEGPDDMLGMYYYHGPVSSGGTSTVEGAKRAIRRSLLQQTCPHRKETASRAVGKKPRFIYCVRCDKMLRREAAQS